MTELTFKDRVLGGLWGAVVGDALGVPVEFRSRAEVQRNPVTDLRGQGTYHQPKGTWSDDSSLMLCTVDSLVRHEFDTADMGQRFVQWSQGKLWTPWGRVFDIGGATSQALGRIQQGVPAEEAGGTDENSNGNGSLMRILPIALRFGHEPAERLLEFAYRASAITHRHPRSEMACGFYSLVAAGLLRGQSAKAAYQSAAQTVGPLFKAKPLAGESHYFAAALAPNLATLPEKEIASGGHVVDTLTASIWCLLTSKDYEETVLKAVNLGEDTDTTGIAAGGLAGICYGLPSVPEQWRSAMARAEDLETLFEQFADLCAVE
jgi:ADP-ribosylglycohydrolase